LVKVTAGHWPPTSVDVTLVPLKLGEFNTITQKMAVDVELIMSWFDTRTAFNASCASELALAVSPCSLYPHARWTRTCRARTARREGMKEETKSAEKEENF